MSGIVSLSSPNRGDGNQAAKLAASIGASNGPLVDALKSRTGPESRNGLAPAATVEISDRARTLIDRSKSASDAAEGRTDGASAAERSDVPRYSRSAPSTYSFLTPISFLDSLMPPGGKDIEPDVKWQAGAPHGDPTKSDALFIRDLALSSITMDSAGWPPEIGRALEQAIRSGSVKIQKASEVEGLNFKSWHTFTPNRSNGAGYDSMGGTTQNPVGAVKTAIDSGRGLAMWTADRGDVYLSW